MKKVRTIITAACIVARATAAIGAVGFVVYNVGYIKGQIDAGATKIRKEFLGGLLGYTFEKKGVNPDV